MDSPSIADAVAKATPNVAELLDRHARWCARMCRNLPSVARETCRNLPSQPPLDAAKPAQTCRNVPEPAGTCHPVENGGTNPPAYRPPAPSPAAAARPLSDRQLAAALLTVSGHGSVAIGRHLGVNRHTVAGWKQNPAFAIEVGRLRAYMTASALSRPAPGPTPRTAPAPPPPLRPPRMTRRQIDQEDRECEAMIEQMLRGSSRVK